MTTNTFNDLRYWLWAAGALVLASLVHAAPPPNDQCAAAIEIPSFPATITFDTTEATPNPGDPNACAKDSGGSVWYHFTAPVDGAVAMDVSLASYGYWSLHTGTCDALSNDGFRSCGWANARYVGVVGGRQYYLQLIKRADDQYPPYGNVTIHVLDCQSDVPAINAQCVERKYQADPTRDTCSGLFLGSSINYDLTRRAAGILDAKKRKASRLVRKLQRTDTKRVRRAIEEVRAMSDDDLAWRDDIYHHPQGTHAMCRPVYLQFLQEHLDWMARCTNYGTCVGD